MSHRALGRHEVRMRDLADAGDTAPCARGMTPVTQRQRNDLFTLGG